MMMEGLVMVQSFANIALFLIALALGYLVLYFANREEKDLRTLGIILGAVIIIISSVAIIGKIVMRAKVCQMMKKCQRSQMMRPEMGGNRGWMTPPPGQPGQPQ
ncbi:MAG: hypothetical protein PHT31_04205 [Candidatus Omnitrophica bacterium]|nr:hypothetical protein [Candidatus Omnitrophota bacterium]MDD5653351.1 hypothetical protein [Candidatus Omnitrophota bacterium]